MFALKSRNYFSHCLSIITLCSILISPHTIKSQSISETIVTTENEQRVFENNDKEFSVTVFEDGKLKSRYVEDPDSIMNVIVVFHEPPAKVQNKRSNIKNIDLSSIQNIKSAHEIFKSDLSQIIQSLKNNGIDILSVQITHEYVHAVNGMALQTTRRVVDQLDTHPMVASVHPDGEVKALINDNAKFVGADSARAKYNVTGKGVLVGVLDTGVDYFHDVLGGGIGENFRVIGGYDFAKNDNDPMDEHGHGTWVSGIIGGNGDSLTGMAPEVNFLAVRVLDEYGRGSGSDVIAGIEYCMDPDGNPSTDDGVNIINMSFGDDEGDADDPVSLAVDNAFANGILCVVAAGNEGYGSEINSPFNTISSPGSAKSALTVGASDLNDEITWFSSKGPAPGSFGIKPEIVAPGLEITSSDLDNGYNTGSGTSASSPIVAGAAALIMEHHLNWDNTQVKSALINSAKRLTSVESPYIQGNGRLDVIKSFEQSILISPATVSFGIVDLAVDIWQSQDMLIVNNPTDSSITLNLYPPEWVAGITFNLSKDNFTLNPGESDSLIVSIQVSKEVPFLNEDPFSYYGDIICVASSDTFTIPCGFTKTRQLIIETSLLSKLLLIWREDSPIHYEFRDKVRASLPIEQGSYRIFSVMKDSLSNIYFVEKKDVLVENLTYAILDHKSTIFESPQVYYGKNGDELDPDNYKWSNFGTTWYREYETETGDLYGISVGTTFIGYNSSSIHSMPLDENYIFQHVRIHHMIDSESPITLMQKFKRSIEFNEDLSLNDGPNGLKRYYMELPEPELNGNNSEIVIGGWLKYNGFQALYRAEFSTGDNLIKGPVDIAYEQSPLTDDDLYSSYTFGYNMQLGGTEDNVGMVGPEVLIGNNGELTTFIKDSFYGQKNYFTRLGSFQEEDTLHLPSINSDVFVPNLSVFWNESIVAHFANNIFSTSSLQSMQGFFEGYRPRNLNIKTKFVSHLFGDGIIKDKYNSVLGLHNYLHSEIITNEFQINLQTSPYEVLGQYGNSSLFHRGNVNNNFENPLSLFHFDVRSGDKIRQWISAGGNNKINFHIRNSEQNLSSIKVMLINKLAEEREITVSHVDGIQYSADIPDDLTSGFYGVHLIAKDQYQEPLEFIADPAFYFGAKDDAPTPHAYLNVENYYPIDSTYYTMQPDTNDLLTLNVKNIGVETANNIKYYVENSASIGVFVNDTVEVVGIYPDSIKIVQIPIYTTVNLPVDSLVRVNLIAEWESAGQLYKRRFYLTLGTAKVPTSVYDIDNAIAKDFVLYQNYPNPFNPSTVISYTLPSSVKGETANVKLIVYDVLGREVATLVNKEQSARNYQVTFDASNLTSGIYFYKIQAGSFTDIKKMLLIK